MSQLMFDGTATHVGRVQSEAQAAVGYRGDNALGTGALAEMSLRRSGSTSAGQSWA